MSIWTLNGTDIDELPIEGITLEFRSMAADRASFLVSVDAGASVPSQLTAGGTVTLAKSGTTVFKGTAQEPGNTASGPTEQVTVMAFGPWHDLEQAVHHQSYAYENGSTDTPRCIISGAPETYLDNNFFNKTEVQAILGKGTVDIPTDVLTKKEVVNITQAQMLKHVLRDIHGVITSFDYTYTPPKLNILKPSSTSLVEITADVSDEAADLDWEKDTEQQFTKVTIFYERKLKIVTRQRNDWESDQDSTEDTWETVSTDTYPAGTSYYGPGKLTMAVPLDGEKVTKIWSRTWNMGGNPWSWYLTKESGSTTWYRRLQFLCRLIGKDMYYSTVNSEWTPLVNYNYCVGYTIDSEDRMSTNGPATINRAENYVLANWVDASNPLYGQRDMRIYPELWGESGFYLYRVKVRTYWNSADVYSSANALPLEFFVARYSNSSSLLDKTISKDAAATVDTLESAPSGIAQELYDRFSVDRYRGHITLEGSEVTVPAALARKASITNGASELASGWVQSLQLNVLTGRLTARFGPPDHLSPQDYLEALRSRDE